MQHPYGRRLFVSLAAAAAAALSVAVPAYADNSAGVTVHLADTTVAVGADVPVEPVLRATKDVTLYDAKMTYKLSGGLTGVSLAEMDGVGNCTSESATELVCSTPFEIDFGPEGVVGYLSAGLKAGRTAVSGESGTLSVTFSADDLDPITETAAVRVADAVDLAAGKSQEVKVAVGASFDAPLSVSNVGGSPVNGAGLVVYADYPYEPTTQFSNCTYSSGRLRSCTFDQDLEPGATYKLSLPFKVRKETYAPSTLGGEFLWMTADDFQDYTRQQSLAAAATTGKGAALTLQKVSTIKAKARQTDSNPDNNWQNYDVDVTGKQGSDLAAVGAAVKGAAGDVVEAAVGLRNNGPANLDWSRSGESPGLVVVTIPTGTTVTTVPDGCSKAEPDYEQTNPKAVQYACFTGSTLLAGTTVTWKFGLRIDTVVANATGPVEVNPACACQRFSADLDKSNNKASLIVNGDGTTAPGDGSSTGGGATGGGAAGGGSTGGGSAEGGDGGGGGLPVTGPQSAAIGGAGAVLVAAGVVGFLMARRRRTRFEA